MSGITPWQGRVRPVKDGEQVRASVTNRPTTDLTQRTQHLKDRIDQMQAGEAVFDHDAPLASSVLVGQPVYWNAVTGQYEKALAAVVFDAALNAYVHAPSAYVAGICFDKATATRGDICLTGVARAIDWTDAIGSSGVTPAEAGAYYLSGTEAGKLVKARPAVAVMVGYLYGETDGAMRVVPTPSDVLDSHVHYIVTLFAQPSGRLDCVGHREKYEFIEIDLGMPGWLPVSAFDPAIVPVGAKYGYNMDMHPELKRLWPPMPPTAGVLETDGVGVPAGRYSLDSNGLWWYEDCQGLGPWPADPRPCGSSSSSSSSSESSSSSSSSSLCPERADLEQLGYVRHPMHEMEMVLYFTKMLFKTDDNVVTSLRPSAGSPIKVLGCDGLPATVGDLNLDLDLSLVVTDGDDGYKALKGVSGETFSRGYVVTALRLGTGVSLTPTAGKGVLLPDGRYVGELTIGMDPNLGVGAGGAELVALNGVREDSYQDVFYLGMPQDRVTSFRLKLDIPRTGVPDTMDIVLWAWLMSRASGTNYLPALGVTGRVLPKPASPCTSVEPLPLSDDITLSLDGSGCSALNINEYIEVETDPFSVNAGEVVFLTVTRNAPDGLSGDIGVLRIGYRAE